MNSILKRKKREREKERERERGGRTRVCDNHRSLNPQLDPRAAVKAFAFSIKKFFDETADSKRERVSYFVNGHSSVSLLHFFSKFLLESVNWIILKIPLVLWSFSPHTFPISREG